MAPNDNKGDSTEMVQERRLTRKRVAAVDVEQPSKVFKETIVEKVLGDPETPAVPNMVAPLKEATKSGKRAKVAKPTKGKPKVVVPSRKGKINGILAKPRTPKPTKAGKKATVPEFRYIKRWVPKIYAGVVRIIAQRTFKKGQVMYLCVYRRSFEGNISPALLAKVDECRKATGLLQLPSDGDLKKKFTRYMREELKELKATGKEFTVDTSAAEADFDVLGINSILEKSDKAALFELVWAPLWLPGKECHKFLPDLVRLYKIVNRIPLRHNRRPRRAAAAK